MEKGEKLNKYARRVYNAAELNGFSPELLSVSHQLALTIAEVGEAVNADRNGRLANVDGFENYIGDIDWGNKDSKDKWSWAFRHCIKDSIEDELADVVILLLEVGKMVNIDFVRPTLVRYNRDFTEYDFAENAFALMKGIANPGISIQRRLVWSIEFVFNWYEAIERKVPKDLWYFIDRKIEYNSTRKQRNGKKY